MRRDQEGRQCQGLGTIFKPLKERYGKTDESQWTTHCGGFHMFDPMKEVLRGRRFSSDGKVIGAVQNLLKTQPENFPFSDGIKKKIVKRWNRCVEVEGDYVEK
jgi:hypothetical protein